MQPNAPLLHDDLFTVGVEPKPEKPSNIAKRVEIKQGDVEAGFQKADLIVEREFKTAPVHQGYIEPHAALASVSEDGSTELWCCVEGHCLGRAHCARLVGLDIAKTRVTASEIGGGFGGKTVVYLEPLALALSRKAKRPVKMVMSREEVFKASGPTSGATVRVKMGATKGGKFVAGFAELKYQAGAFQGSPVQPGVMCAYAPYDIENVKVIGYDVVPNRPKVAADELGVPYDKVRPIIGDTGSLGFNFLTGGSRSAFSGSMAIVEAAKQIKTELCARACKLWDLKPDQVEFAGGQVKALGAAAEKFKPMSIADFAKVAGKTGGPIGGSGPVHAQGPGPRLGTH